MARSRSDERLLERIRREAPDAPDAKVDMGAVVGRLLKAKPESKEARRTAKAKAKTAAPGKK